MGVSGRVSAAMWGWMWTYGPVELLQIDVRLNGEKYIAILEAMVWSVPAMALPAPLPIKVVELISCF